MFRPAKTRVGLIFKKAAVCVAVCGIVATSASAASLARPQASPVSSTRLFGAAIAGLPKTASVRTSLLAAPGFATNVMAKAPMAMVQAGGGGIVSSISSNFNATAIPAGDTIWFSAVMKLNGTVPRTPVSIAVHHSTIQFTAGGINYSLNVPDSVVTFSPTTTAASTTFDTANNAQPVWLESQLNPQPSGNTLLQAFAFPMPAGGLPGGIKNVTWTSSFSSDTANITLNWQWAAAVYTGCVNSAYNSDDVKPTDDNTTSIYKNSDHAGTPEACKNFVTQGATGGGASNYTGSLSGTASVTPPLVVAAPVISSTISPPPNGNGWNNTNVTVRFSCSDANFAIATCPAPVTVSSEGAAQIITGTAVDQAGNGASSSTSVTINLDKSSPSIIATATSPSGNGGVLTLPVTVTFTCADSVSGVDSCPASIQVTSAGANETFSGTAIDKAGNTASASIALNTQSAPLAITASISPAPINGWNKTDVTISYQCTGGVPPVQCPQPVTVTAEGAAQVISATATDAAGQPSSIATTLNIDKTAPAISAEAAPVANAAGWNTEDVTITYTCSDSLSGIAVCPQPRVVSVEGKAQVISASVSDVAGNTASANTTINLEKTAPLITGSITPAPNAAGWNNSDVTVNFTCTPSVSDIVSCPPPVPVTQGMGQEISGSVTDQAGKSNSAAVTVNIDKIPPVITAVISPQPNAAGWNNTPVTVTFTCSDAGSGIAACSGPIQVSTEGSNQVVVGMATDQAGNTVQIPVTLKIDATPPVITSVAAPQPNAAGWNTTPVTITYACSDSLSGVQACPQPQVAGTEGKAQQYTASVTDQAGNTANSVVLLNLEFTAPSITTLLTPSPNAGGWNNADVTVNFNCVPSASDIVSCPAPVLISAEGRGQSIPGTVTDQAGKSATATALVNLDKTPPLITASAAPPANAAGWNNTDVTITYLCSDGLSGIAVCPSPTAVSSEGAAESFSAQAVDQAGNFSTISTTLNIDKTPPIVTAVTAPPANGAGWNNTDVTVTYSCSDGLSGVASCPSTAVISSEGQNQSVPGQARDIAGNAGTAAVSVSIDKTAPTIIQITAPDHISRLHGGQVSVTVNDNFSVSQVVISANDTPLGTFSAAPYQVDLQVPVTANPGDTVTVTVQATDAAGNTQMSSRGVRVSADGVVVGQVLSDVTSFPIPGAVVQAITKASLSDQTNDRGRYSLQVSDSHLFVTAMSAAPATTTVEREVFVQEGVGTVPVDARLTPLASPVAIGSAGGTLVAGNVSIAVPAATVGDGTSFQLTPLSGQGLPGLLPLGWSPVAAFDLRATSSAANLPASFSKLPNVVGNLVLYNPALHAWTMVASNLQVVNGGLTVMLPAPASYALVVPDLVDPPIVIPAPGDPLTGINMQQLSPQASSSGALSPATLPPSGGTSTATLGVQSVTYVPSGTVIQANVSEKFSLKSGSAVSDEVRSEDIVLYGALAPTGSSLGAQFPVAPSHKFANTELLTGEVHLDILAGREGVRGQPGGSDPLTLSDGTSTLFVPGGALSEDTAISVQSIALEDFIPVSSTLNALQETLVDFSGETLNTPAQLSIPAIALDPTHTFLLARVERLDGVPRMVATALARINGANLTTVPSPGLPGLVKGGEYVFYDITAPVGFAQGIVSTSAGPVQAVVQSDSLPIADITEADGHYIVPALAGTVNLSATAPHTNLIGSVSAPVVAGQTVVANITLVGTVTNAVISPADGSLGVPVSTVITVTTTAPLNAQSIQQANLVLLKSSAPVALQPFVLSNSGTVLSFAPQKNLDPATQYTIHVSGLADIFGGAVIVPSATFTTKAVAPPNFNPNAITFSFPDANGNIHVSAPAGSLPPGTRVMIVDQTNGLVLSLTALNDGSISGDFLGTVNDLLQITVTDPNGATASFTRSQFVAPDGTVAVGPGGGTITGPGGVELRIPDGALDQAATFKIEAFGPDLFPERPDIPGASFGSGLKISSPEKPMFKKEVKLAFPKPADAPDGAFYEAYRRMQGPNGQYFFESLDRAAVEGQGANAQVVTASFPFSGYATSYDAFVLGGPLGGPAVQAGLDNYVFLMWMFDQLRPGVSLGGAVTGRVRYAVPPGGSLPDGTLNRAGDTVFVGVPGVVVAVDVNDSTHVFANGAPTAITQQDGTFTFGDSRYFGGTVKVVAYAPTGIGTATAVETVVLTDKSIDVFAGPLLPYYRNVAFADIVVPAPTPPPPTPKIAINLYTLDQNNLRVPANGLIPDGTALVVALKVDSSISQPPNITINGAPYSTQQDAPDAANDPLKQDFELTDKFISSGPGIYKIVATGLTAFAQTVTSTRSFMVVGAASDNNVIKVGTAPEIVSTSPVAGAEGVSAETFVQVLFSEPVTNIPGNISLVPDDGSTPPTLQFSGIDYRNGAVISSLGSADAVSSLTIRPASGLKFGMHYTIQATSAIKDLDNVADPTKPALGLVPPASPIGFSTFGPQVLGGTAPFSSTRVVVMGDRAYVAKYENATLSFVHAYDLSDPANPAEITIGTAGFVGRAQDTAGEENAPVIGGGNLLAVGAGVGAFEFGLPSNLWLYNVSGDQIQRVGAVSVTGSTVNEGQLVRVTLHGNFAYSGTYPVGIQVVDLQQAISEYNDVFTNNPAQFGVAITTDGQGFARDAVINTIPVNDSAGHHFMVFGIQAGEFVMPGSDPANPTTQTYVVSAGTVPGALPNTISFIVADPTSPAPPSYADILRIGGSSLDSGRAVTLGQLTDSIPDADGNPVQKPVAVVVGVGSASDPAVPGSFGQGGVLAVVDMSNPLSPQVLSMLKLETTPTDVVLYGTTALVGTGVNKVLLVNLLDPRNPVNAGSIAGGTFGDRLAVTADGLLIGSSLDGNRGGIRVATLGVVPKLQVDTSGLVATVDKLTSEDITLNYQIVGDLSQVSSAQVKIIDDTGKTVFTASVPVKAIGSVVWPAGQPLDVTPDTISFKVLNPDGGSSEVFAATAENSQGDAPTPVVLSASPATVVVAGVTTVAASGPSDPSSQASTGTMIDIRGRNFIPAVSAQLIAAGSDANSALTPDIQFVSSQEVKITPPADFFAQANNWTLRLMNGNNGSNDYTLHVVPAGLPSAPVLTSIDPSPVPLSDPAQDTTITVSGANFVDGDTIAKAGFEDADSPAELTVQVISPTTMQVVIPAEWMVAPVHMSLFLQSLQHPELQSGALDVQIGQGNSQVSSSDSSAISDLQSAITDSAPVPSAPNAPALNAVADGFVPLADSNATQPTLVMLQGSGFQPGASVIVNVDGTETSLPADSVADSQVGVKIPPPLFSLKTYTFDFQINLQQATGGHPLHAQVHANAGKVTFKNQLLYAAGTKRNLGGFHQRTTAPNNPPDYFLMVPSAGSNKAIAVIAQNVLQPNGAKVTFDPANAALISAQPASTQLPQVTLTAAGKNLDQPAPTDLVANKNVKGANGQIVKTPVGTLHVQLLKHHLYNVYLHYVTEVAAPAQNVQCKNLPLLPAKTPATKAAYDARVSAFKSGLNGIWLQQANVEFNVLGVQGTAGSCQGEVIPEQVHYDLNGDHNLRINGTHNPETDTIINAIAQPPLPAGVDAQIHVYFVKSFLNSLSLIDAHIPNGLKVGSPYAMTLKFDGGVAPYNYQFLGQLPPGMVNTSSGQTVRISGTPQAAGAGQAFLESVRVTDSANNTIGIDVLFQIVALPNSSPKPQLGATQGLPNPTNCCTLGFVTKIGEHTLFVDDRTPTSQLVHVLAHEIGHALNLNHPRERPNLPPQFAAALPTGSCIPNLTNADSDYSDDTNLMWWVNLPQKRQSHLGIRQWSQLNGSVGSLPACH